MGYNNSKFITELQKKKNSQKGGEYITEEEMQQDAKTVEQIIDDMNLFDDDLMSMVFDATELLLKNKNARLNGLLESINNLMKNMKLGAEQAMNALEVSDRDREILQKRL